MNDIKSLRAMLYTLGNVTTKEVTKFAFMNKTADPVTKRRSQEIYDALSEKLNIYMVNICIPLSLGISTLKN